MQVSDSAAPAVPAGDYLFPYADSATPGHMQRAAVAGGASLIHPPLRSMISTSSAPLSRCAAR
jgi:hypothetical protein